MSGERRPWIRAIDGEGKPYIHQNDEVTCVRCGEPIVEGWQLEGVHGYAESPVGFCDHCRDQAARELSYPLKPMTGAEFLAWSDKHMKPRTEEELKAIIEDIESR